MRFAFKPKNAALVGAFLGAVLCLFSSGPTGRLLFDGWQRMAPRQIATDKVAVVLIDDLSLEVVSAWPWPRYYMAHLTAKIGQQIPAVVGFDMIFPEPDPMSPDRFAEFYPEIDKSTSIKISQLESMDSVFAAAIAETPTVLPRLGVPFNGREPDELLQEALVKGQPPPNTPVFEQVLASLPEFEGVSYGLAAFNGTPDSDAIVRRVPLTIKFGDTPLPGLAVELARIATGAEQLVWRGTDLWMGDKRLPANDAGQLTLRFGQLPASQVFSAADVLADRVPAGAFTGKVVLVGLGALGTADIIATPLATENFGVLVQAQAVDAILNRGWLSRPAWLVGLEWLGGALLALLVWLSAHLRRRWVLLFAAGFTVVLLQASFVAFDLGNLLFNSMTPVIIGVFALAGADIARAVEQERARLRIHRAFDKYLSPELVERIARDPSHLELGGEERDMTVMFCDVRGFSAISENMSPQNIIQFLIGLLTPMTDILLAGRATIDKYVGDAIIAFWNAPVDDPLHASNAADAALAMIARLRELNSEMPRQEKYPWPGDVKIGIGLNSGMVCVGNMGSERRLNYSMIGDTVNLASRIEGLTKFYGVDIAIGADLADRLAQYALIQLDLVKVIGRTRPEKIFALLGGSSMKETASFERLAGNWQEFYRLYRSQQWDEALSRLESVDSEGEWCLARLCAIYSDRIAELKADPPGDDWAGVYIAKEK